MYLVFHRVSSSCVVTCLRVFHHWYTLTQFMTWKCISPKSSRSFLIKYSLSWFFQNKLFINIIFITYYLHIIISHNLCCSLYRKLLLYHYWQLRYTRINNQELFTLINYWSWWDNSKQVFTLTILWVVEEVLFKNLWWRGL